MPQISYWVELQTLHHPLPGDVIDDVEDRVEPVFVPHPQATVTQGITAADIRCGDLVTYPSGGDLMQVTTDPLITDDTVTFRFMRCKYEEAEVNPTYHWRGDARWKFLRVFDLETI